MGPDESAHRRLRITGRLTIPVSEVTVRASRSSGPGGQHANVTASRVEASFDVLASRSLTDDRPRTAFARSPSGASRRITERRDTWIGRFPSTLAKDRHMPLEPDEAEALARGASDLVLVPACVSSWADEWGGELPVSVCSVHEHGQVEIGEALGVGQDVHLGDLAVADRAGHDRERLAVPARHESRRAVDERRLVVETEP
jgi:hypothetical protein